MKTEEIDYLDGVFQVQEEIPTTFEEISALIGPESVVEEAVFNLYYRNKYPRVYKRVSSDVESLGFKRKVVSTKTLKDGTVREVKESENDHLRAYLKGRFAKNDEGKEVQTEPAPEGSKDTLQELFVKHGQSEPLFVKGERAGGGGKVAQAALTTANGFFAAGDEKVEEVATKIEALVPGYKVGRDGEGSVTPESLARGIQALNKHLENLAKKQASAALA